MKLAWIRSYRARGEPRGQRIWRFESPLQLLESFEAPQPFHEDLWTDESTREELVPLAQILDTRHSGHRSCWHPERWAQLKEECARLKRFPGPRGDPGPGYKHSWRPLAKRPGDVIELGKHPTRAAYVVIGQGNHRVMKSKMSADAPCDVYAQVTRHRWSLLAEKLMALAKLEFDVLIACEHSDDHKLGIWIQPPGRPFYVSHKVSAADEHDLLALRLKLLRAQVERRKPRTLLALARLLFGATE